MTAEPRPLAHLRDAERDYGRDLWRRYERLIADVRGSGETWPAWCHAPMAAAYAIVSGGGNRRVPPERTADIARLAALAAWRTTKGIYRYDPDLLEALWTTPLDGALPTELLTRLPEWCVYLELEGRSIEDAELHGAYVHLEHDHETGGVELRILLDTDSPTTLAGSHGSTIVSGLVPAPIHLGAESGTLADGARASALKARAEAVAAGIPDMYMRAIEQRIVRSLEMLAPIVSLVLYLCTEEPDLLADDDPERRPQRPKGRATGAQRVTTWETGARIGAALRRARERSEGDYSSGERAAPIGHVRRAHWHTYWVGSEKRGNRRRQLRWLSPMLVNVRDGDGPELVAAIHPVDSEAGEELTPEQVQLLTRIADAGDAGVERPTQWHGASVAGWQHTADALVIRGLIRWDHGEAAKRAPGYRITVEGTARLAAFRRRT